MFAQAPREKAEMQATQGARDSFRVEHQCQPWLAGAMNWVIVLVGGIVWSLGFEDLCGDS